MPGLHWGHDDAGHQGRLESVADGVAEVEERARTGLALVAGDDARLETDRAFDQRNERLGVSGGGLFQIALAQIEEVAALEERTFDYLGKAAPALAQRERGEHVRVADDQPGLVESADQVLARPQVRAGLSPQAGV